MAISVAPLTTVVMNAVTRRRAGVASGINNAVSRTAGLVSIAVMGIFILLAFSDNLDRQMASMNLPADARRFMDEQRIRLAAAEVPEGLGNDHVAALERAIDAAFVAGFRLVMLLCAGLALMSGVSAAVILENQPAPRE